MSLKPEELEIKSLAELDTVDDDAGLEAWRVRYLGRKGELTGVLRGLSALPADERKVVGAAANKLKNLLEQKLEDKKTALTSSADTGSDEAIDITLPGTPYPSGHVHPITATTKEMCDIFVSLGFSIATGPDVEWDYYNFEALNIPPEHAARDSQSTFWVGQPADPQKGPMLLRTQMTAVTARSLAANDPPIRLVEPGRVYRYEATDATHEWMFNHIDGIVVDKNITMADLKGTLYEFARRFFGQDRKVRFRCDFFPFVEPGVEMAIECAVCHGDGCRLCSNSGWIEVLGAGMTHPEVLRHGGIDPAVYSSFAFGIGIDRLPMLKYGINDIRLFYGGDTRFLRQF